jgi:hypothetical protein
MRPTSGGRNLVLQAIFVRRAYLDHKLSPANILCKVMTEAVTVRAQTGTSAEWVQSDLTKKRAMLVLGSILQEQFPRAALVRLETTATRACNFRAKRAFIAMLPLQPSERRVRWEPTQRLLLPQLPNARLAMQGMRVFSQEHQQPPHLSALRAISAFWDPRRLNLSELRA